ncbi:tetratricopeptide repeat protein [Desulfitobacterium sp. AusDCA]|uniref:tetratricopeptide repeat protein n=1 Tax=Desulfitobacterium sp. AusDCA TaxID=3240383 RepID=UPI003DA737F2
MGNDDEKTVNEISNNTHELKVTFDTKTGDTLVSCKDASVSQPNDIIHNIANVLSRVFNDFGIDTVDSIEKALLQNNIIDAYKLLEKGRNKGLLHFSSHNTKIRLFHLVHQIPPLSLMSEERKNFYEIKFVLAQSTGLFSYLFDDASQYMDEFGDQAKPELMRNLLLLKANAASQQGKKELAYSLYQDVLKESGNDFGTLGWAHRGLAITLGYNNPDAIYHEKMAADAFLLDGNKTMYVSCKAVLAEYTKADDPQKALELLEEAINVFNPDDPLEKDQIAALSLNKAMIYNLCGDNEAALKEAERSIKLRELPGKFGNEAKRIASLNAAIQFEEALEPDETKRSLKDIYQKKVKELEEFMLDSEKASYSLRKRLANELSEKNAVKLKEMKQEVLEQDDAEIKVLYWASLVLVNNDDSLISKLELLETAWSEANKPNVRNDVKSNVCTLFAEIYMENGMDEKALEWYKMALDFNPFFWVSRQNYAALLWKNNKWEEAVRFFDEQRKRFGDLPSILFGYGKSLVEAGKSEEAISILRQAQRKDPEAQYIGEYLNKALDKSEGYIQVTSSSSSIIISDTITIASFEQCLIDFSMFIKNDKRMTFWRYNTEQKKHVWVPSPEQHGQDLLHSFIKSRFSNNVEAIEEVDTGAGRMDIYLRFQNGFKTIVELKMCGGGYSEGYALEGIEQLAHYLENKHTHLGYLVIFDSRIRDMGRGINPHYSYENYTVRSFIVDVRSVIKHKGR